MTRVVGTECRRDNDKERYDILFRLNDGRESATFITDEMYDNPVVFIPFMKRLLDYARHDYEDAPSELEGAATDRREG